MAINVIFLRTKCRSLSKSLGNGVCEKMDKYLMIFGKKKEDEYDKIRMTEDLESFLHQKNLQPPFQIPLPS